MKQLTWLIFIAVWRGARSCIPIEDPDFPPYLEALTTTTSTTTMTTTTMMTTTTPVCPTGYTTLNMRCFIFVNMAVDEPTAAANCVAMGDTLASIHDGAENNLIYVLSGMNPVWLGITRTCPQNVITCFSNIDGTPFDHTAFNNGVPTNTGGNSNCVQMNTPTMDGGWGAVTCTMTAPYVCARPL